VVTGQAQQLMLRECVDHATDVAPIDGATPLALRGSAKPLRISFMATSRIPSQWKPKDSNLSSDQMHFGTIT
jgi:hypothetical protein